MRNISIHYFIEMLPRLHETFGQGRNIQTYNSLDAAIVGKNQMKNSMARIRTSEVTPRERRGIRFDGRTKHRVPSPSDWRVAHVLRQLELRPDTRISAAAASVGLSASGLRHLVA